MMKATEIRKMSVSDLEAKLADLNANDADAAAKIIAGSTGISLAPYTLAALVYFCINYPASKGIEAIERRMRRGDKQ